MATLSRSPISNCHQSTSFTSTIFNSVVRPQRLCAAFFALTSPGALSFSSLTGNFNIRRTNWLSVSSTRPSYLVSLAKLNLFHLSSASSFHFACKLPDLRGGGALFSTFTDSAVSLQTETVSSQLDSEEKSIVETSNMSSAERLQALRSRMKDLGLDVYLIPSDDPHLSEYVPTAYMRRHFISGFHGSAGTCVVTDKEALLWTDSRYWNEASLQLDETLWTLQKAGLPSTPTISKWLSEQAVKHYNESNKEKVYKIGIDPFVHSASSAKELENTIKEAAKKELNIADENIKIAELVTTLDHNLIDEIWGENRPPVPTSPFRVHPIEYAGVTVAEKLEKIRKEMQEKKATMAVFPSLDDVAYLLNVRCTGDVESNPVGIAYVTVTMDDVKLYCDTKKVEEPDVQEHLKEISIVPYDTIVSEITNHCQETSNKVWIDKSRANFALCRVVPENQIIDEQNAVVPMKAVKNDAELEGMRQAHVVDGIAMAKFMAWLEDQIVNQERSVSEVEIDEKLTGFRAEQDGFIEVSFPTIAGVGSNGAIIHYRARSGNELMKYLNKENPILIDSGGQYTYGTTDVTRTWHFGTATPIFTNWYTRVLKGHIGMDEMIFPENIPGFAIDIYARRWLWDAGKDYGHGTGHGVGAALNVHEGPMSISPRWVNKEGLKKGMIVSDEPGYYEDGNFGIRIENLLEIKYVNPEDDVEKAANSDAPKSADKKFLKFDQLTLIPIQQNLVDLSIMTERELNWLDAYHEKVFEKISPLLDADSPELAWLTKSCVKIDRSNMRK